MKTYILSILIALAFVVSTSDLSAQAPRSGKIYYIKSLVGSNAYLSTLGKRSTQRTKIVINRYSAAKVNQWKVQSAGGGWYFLINQQSRLALDVQSARKTAGASLWLWPLHRGDAQKFKFTRQRDGSYQIVPKVNTSLRLDVERAKVTPGTKVWTYHSNTSNAQKWKFKEVRSTPTSGGGSSTAGLQKYALIIESIKCIREDDPGSEIELFGKMGVYTKKASRAKTDLDFWNKSSSNCFNVNLGQTRAVSPNVGYFHAKPAELLNGTYEVFLKTHLYEHDGSSANEDFTAHKDRWTIRRLGANMHTTLSVDGTSIQIKWRVEKSGGSTGRQKKYRLSVESIKCTREDDPGSEIELFGTMQIQTHLNRSRKENRTFWRRTSSNLFEVDKNETKRLSTSTNYHDFYANPADIASGAYTIDLVTHLHEHDDSSENEDFTKHTERWNKSLSLGTPRYTYQTVDGTTILLKWTVKQIR